MSNTKVGMLGIGMHIMIGELAGYGIFANAWAGGQRIYTPISRAKALTMPCLTASNAYWRIFDEVANGERLV